MKVVLARQRDRYRTEILMGEHRLRADEPVTSGGADTGPNPYHLLLASLGACTVMTIQWYAERKGLRIEGVEVTLEYDRIHAEDCKSCDQTDPLKRIEHVNRRVRIQGDLPPDEREKLLSIPAKCPVSRTLKGGLVIEDQVTFD